jgi:hypothetical protein
MRRKVRWGLLSTANINKALIGPIQAAPRNEIYAKWRRWRPVCSTAPPVVSLADSHNFLRSMLAIYESARTGQVVRL